MAAPLGGEQEHPLGSRLPVSAEPVRELAAEIVVLTGDDLDVGGVEREQVPPADFLHPVGQERVALAAGVPVGVLDVHVVPLQAVELQVADLPGTPAGPAATARCSSARSPGAGQARRDPSAGGRPTRAARPGNVLPVRCRRHRGRGRPGRHAGGGTRRRTAAVRVDTAPVGVPVGAEREMELQPGPVQPLPGEVVPVGFRFLTGGAVSGSAMTAVMRFRRAGRRPAGRP